MRGFTLLEVMVALAIVAAVLLTVISSVNYHLSVVTADRGEATAMLLARGKLEELEQEKSLPEKRDGNFAPAHPDYAWKVETEPLEISGMEIPGGRRDSLTVTWEEKKRSLTLVYYVAP